ncbi:hypothetical protein LR48_Vigan01g010200 [Vigna angularis]|uniref:Uncharacterized protein n=1 Tax=Phaseolus angularis TaxID=3914 RepID=A0A0L9TIW5_PHAAN|nr:hypothetical protein LR48_Vigan01g010200 [Vigna angularis]
MFLSLDHANCAVHGFLKLPCNVSIVLGFLELGGTSLRLCRLVVRIDSHSESLWRDALCQGHSHSELVRYANDLRGRYAPGWGLGLLPIFIQIAKKGCTTGAQSWGYLETPMVFHSQVEMIESCHEE